MDGWIDFAVTANLWICGVYSPGGFAWDLALSFVSFPFVDSETVALVNRLDFFLLHTSLSCW